eukprot:gene11850-15959_t
MNRIAETDSETRLDCPSGQADSVLGRKAMVMAHLHRIDTDANMARFYCIDLAATLFGEVTVLRRWGRIGTRGRSSLETWPSAGRSHDVDTDWRNHRSSWATTPETSSWFPLQSAFKDCASINHNPLVQDISMNHR